MRGGVERLSVCGALRREHNQSCKTHRYKLFKSLQVAEVNNMNSFSVAAGKVKLWIGNYFIKHLSSLPIIYLFIYLFIHLFIYYSSKTLYIHHFQDVL